MFAGHAPILLGRFEQQIGQPLPRFHRPDLQHGYFLAEFLAVLDDFDIARIEGSQVGEIELQRSELVDESRIVEQAFRARELLEPL